MATIDKSSTSVPIPESGRRSSTYDSQSNTNKARTDAILAGKDSTGDKSKSSTAAEDETAATAMTDVNEQNSDPENRGSYVTLPVGTNLLDYLSRPYNCPAPRCPHRYLLESELTRHVEDTHSQSLQSSGTSKEAFSDYYSESEDAVTPAISGTESASENGEKTAK